jgi:hypothetical protein
VNDESHSNGIKENLLISMSAAIRVIAEGQSSVYACSYSGAMLLSAGNVNIQKTLFSGKRNGKNVILF